MLQWPRKSRNICASNYSITVIEIRLKFSNREGHRPMTISTVQEFKDQQDPVDIQQVTRLAQISCQWAVAIGAGGVDDADNAGSDITDPETQIAATGGTTRQPYRVAAGTTIMVRLKYRNTVTTPPVIQVFGRYNSNERYQRLIARGGAIDITLTPNAADLVEGSDLRTSIVIDDHTLDLLGRREFLIGVKTAIAGGSPALAEIEVAVI